MNGKRVKRKRRKNLSCTARATSFLCAKEDNVGITALVGVFIWRRGSTPLHFLKLESVKQEDYTAKSQALRCLK